MLSIKYLFLILLLLSLPAILSTGCSNSSHSPEVVVYTSVDQHFSEPVLKAFENESGIKVRAVYDVEAAKTTGLVNRLIAEKSNPLADVWWNGEFAQTILLKEKGVLMPYDSKSTSDIPIHFRDPENYWAGIAGRARVIIINTELVGVEDYPGGMKDLLNTKWPANKVAIPLPLFGTTATHAAALYAVLGPPEVKDFFQQVKDRGVRIEAGNSTVRDLVANGDLMWGFTDTDDAAGAIERGAPVAVIFPGQDESGIGTLLVPTTVGLISGAPHPGAGKMLIDFLLSGRVGDMLIKAGWCHVPVLDTDAKPKYINAENVKLMDVDLTEVYAHIEQVKEELGEIFIR